MGWATRVSIGCRAKHLAKAVKENVLSRLIPYAESTALLGWRPLGGESLEMPGPRRQAMLSLLRTWLLHSVPDTDSSVLTRWRIPVVEGILR